MSNVINTFPGYEFRWVTDKNGRRKPQNFYRDTDIGFGGYIISNPGMYGNVALIDVASLHPNSLIAMNYFGEYTQAYKDILDTRLLIKHGDFESAKKLMDGRLAKYLDDPSMAKDLSNALKTALNSTYGLTAANFDHVMKHPLNRNNVIALRGALFMRTLQDEVESRGYKIVAIKTDSIKIADADKEIVDFCLDFAKKYSYTFEFEAFYDKMCQVNDADYVARYKDKESCEKIFGYVPGDNNKKAGQWTATGSKFTVPYVFKKLFSHEPIEFKDLCHVFSVQGAALYLDMNENLPDISEYEKEFSKAETQYKKGQLSDTTFESTCAELHKKMVEGHDYKFVGRVGNFCPIKPGFGGGELVVKRNDKYDSANGSKGFRWLESEFIKDVNEDVIDMSYFNKLVDDMINGSGSGKQYKPGIADYGDPEWFMSDDPYIPKEKDFMYIPPDAPEELPWDEVPFK